MFTTPSKKKTISLQKFYNTTKSTNCSPSKSKTRVQNNKDKIQNTLDVILWQKDNFLQQIETIEMKKLNTFSVFLNNQHSLLVHLIQMFQETCYGFKNSQDYFILQLFITQLNQLQKLIEKLIFHINENYSDIQRTNQIQKALQRMRFNFHQINSNYKGYVNHEIKMLFGEFFQLQDYQDNIQDQQKFSCLYTHLVDAFLQFLEQIKQIENLTSLQFIKKSVVQIIHKSIKFSNYNQFQILLEKVEQFILKQIDKHMNILVENNLQQNFDDIFHQIQTLKENFKNIQKFQLIQQYYQNEKNICYPLKKMWKQWDQNKRQLLQEDSYQSILQDVFNEENEIKLSNSVITKEPEQYNQFHPQLNKFVHFVKLKKASIEIFSKQMYEIGQVILPQRINNLLDCLDVKIQEILENLKQTSLEDIDVSQFSLILKNYQQNNKENELKINTFLKQQNQVKNQIDNLEYKTKQISGHLNLLNYTGNNNEKLESGIQVIREIKGIKEKNVMKFSFKKSKLIFMKEVSTRKISYQDSLIKIDNILNPPKQNFKLVIKFEQIISLEYCKDFRKYFLFYNSKENKKKIIFSTEDESIKILATFWSQLIILNLQHQYFNRYFFQREERLIPYHLIWQG